MPELKVKCESTQEPTVKCYDVTGLKLECKNKQELKL